MTLEATLTRIADALETLAANSNYARELTDALAVVHGAVLTPATTEAVQAQAETPKPEKKGGRPKKPAAEAEPTGQDPNTLPLLPADDQAEPAAEITAPTPAPSAEIVEPAPAASYDDMVKAAHAYAAVGTREVITRTLMDLNGSSTLKQVPEHLYADAIVKFNAALAAVNKTADGITF